jgi:glutaconate CoA-transferase, subunit B
MTWSASEMMTVAAARALANDDVCFVGIGLPSAACNLARLTHAPGLTLVYESGTLGTRPQVLPLSIGDGELYETALTTVSVPEMFQYWLQGGRITVGFLGGAQVDRFGNLNSTVIGPYAKPKVRLPGSGGATEISTSCHRIYIVMRHGPKSFVDKLDFVTSLGHGPTGRERRALGLRTEGPSLIVTDLCTMRPDADSKEFEVVTLHPGVTVDTVRENTGWPVRFAAQVHETPAPTPDELAALRDLNARTAQAHGVTAAEARRGTGAPTGAERGHGAPASDGVGESEGRSPSDLVG